MDTAAKIESLINEGINELKAGRKDTARQFLSQAVRTDPGSERAWLYLSAALPPAQAIEALQRVLVINPANKQALRAIEALNNRATAVPGPGDDIPTTVPPALRNTTPVQPENVQYMPSSNDDNQNYDQEEYPQPSSDEEQIYSPYAPQPSERDPQARRYTTEPAYIGNQADEEYAQEAVNPFAPSQLELMTSSYNTDQPLEQGEDLRAVLTQPYIGRPQPKRRSALPLLIGGLLLLLIAAGVALYFTVFTSPDVVSQPTILPTAVANVPATTTLSTEPSATVNSTVAPSPTVELPTATSVALLLPTATPLPSVLNLQVVQNQPAQLNGFVITFSSYDNHSSNFVDGGAGKSRTGTHYEGAVVVIENTLKQVVPLSVKQFQAIDGRNNYAAALDTGRLPALDVTRLQPGERRAAWLTFEVGDGTTLRAVLFSPQAGTDERNSVLVNLVAPVFKGTVAATAKPTSSPTIAASDTLSATVTVDNQTPTVTVSQTATSTVISSAIGKREILNNVALTILAYNAAPNVRPFILPAGYHYESVQIRVENTDATKDISEYLKTFPYVLRDSDGYVYTIGPLTTDGPEHFDPAKFVAGAKTPAATKLTGSIYFLVRDSAKSLPRTLVWYANNDLTAARVETTLK